MFYNPRRCGDKRKLFFYENDKISYNPRIRASESKPRPPRRAASKPNHLATPRGGAAPLPPPPGAGQVRESCFYIYYYFFFHFSILLKDFFITTG